MNKIIVKSSEMFETTTQLKRIDQIKLLKKKRKEEQRNIKRETSD